VSPDPSAVGRIGLLTHATRGPHGAGEVRISIRGGSEIFLAWSDDPLPKGTTVLVVGSRGGRALDVVAWTDH
jgi:membrane protein implicated in regulation of membrane protease activity